MRNCVRSAKWSRASATSVLPMPWIRKMVLRVSVGRSQTINRKPKLRLSLIAKQQQGQAARRLVSYIPLSVMGPPLISTPGDESYRFDNLSTNAALPLTSSNIEFLANLKAKRALIGARRDLFTKSPTPRKILLRYQITARSHNYLAKQSQRAEACQQQRGSAAGDSGR